MLALWALWPVPTLQVINETTRQPLARLAALDGAPLRLSYRHSIYRQPAAEEFVVRADGLELVRLASPSVAVLEYYGRPEPIVPAEGAYEIRPKPERHASLSLLAGAVGQRTVTYEGRLLPLHQLAADGDRILLAVTLAPRLTLLQSS